MSNENTTSAMTDDDVRRIFALAGANRWHLADPILAREVVKAALLAAQPSQAQAAEAEGYTFRCEGKLWVVTDPAVAMRWQEQGFEVTPVVAASPVASNEREGLMDWIDADGVDRGEKILNLVVEIAPKHEPSCPGDSFDALGFTRDIFRAVLAERTGE